jgi:hypothetical protein
MASAQPSIKNLGQDFASMAHTSYTKTSKYMCTLPLSPQIWTSGYFNPCRLFVYSVFYYGRFIRQTSQSTDVSTRPLDFIGCDCKVHLFCPVLARLHRTAATSEILGLTWTLNALQDAGLAMKTWFLAACLYPKLSRECAWE